MSLGKFLGLDKVGRLQAIIRHNGGLWNSLKTLYRTDDLKIGTLVGEDRYGNKYYENPTYFYGTNRWVIYNETKGTNYDGSQIPAEWFGWMHYKTDFPPTEKKPVEYKWMATHKENLSGTKDAYMPYSTTRPKIESWKPGQKQSQQ
ncbi:probable NADH dehydrogenase [ubiquinone] 1 alpha subcomplex subunit 12 [Tigriopus californicus]|uniref:probable NADH dehydrogenase [ubiquinone] 1 alpha subcomplex subunit 12 n=1 Tax=Tigriopus californicus TaxID=6832 RepID=UPI0027DA42D0|nr:probable NADH dehydrogenase [ubiquinone] 1 alpha subcomplex subunit 12 [Tigriopus californicus]